LNGSLLPIESGELVGDKLKFTVGSTLDGQAVKMAFTGRAKAHSIQGSIKTEAETAGKTIKWTAERDPATVVPIEGSDKLH